MGKREASKTDSLLPLYHRYKYQKCFIGHSHNASWSSTLVEVCDEVLPTFGLRPWYADAHFDPTTSLRDKVVEMVANTRYGIYDLSYWRRDEQSPWMMPRNVLIELGMAIALNRPILLLRHASNQVAGLALPDSLQSVGAAFCEFAGGKKSLREALNTHIPQWVERSPEREWRNRYCLFGGLVCDYRGSHPLSPLVAQNTIACHIADGQDIDRDDFRESVEDIIERFDAVSYHYLDDCTPSQRYNFLLCAHCQLVRSTPFAIYRLTSCTPAQTFIAIGISIALEAQFKYKIPKILLTETLDYVPSLLKGYEAVVGRNDQEIRARLTQFLPQVIQRVQETTWKPQALPFEVSLPSKDISLINQDELVEETNTSEIEIEQTNQPQNVKSSKGRQKAFISYSHQDSRYLNRLQMHMKGYEYVYGEDAILDCWDDTQIPKGAIWKEEIEKALESAKVAVLLVSADFLASDFIRNYELPILLDAAQKGKITILSVVLSPCPFDRTQLSRYQSINRATRPVISLPSHAQEEVWAELAKKIYDILNESILSVSPSAEEIIDQTTLNEGDRLQEIQSIFQQNTNKQFTTQEIAAILRINEDTIIRDLHNLSHNGLLPLIKEGRLWVLKENTKLNLPSIEQAITKEITAAEQEEQRRCERIISQLTPRRLEILRAFAEGLHPAEVAERFSISMPTVNTHTTVLLSLCRDVWPMREKERLDYRFLQLKFEKYFEGPGQVENE